MDGRIIKSGWEVLLAGHVESETGEVAVRKSESCCGHPETVKSQGALKEQNMAEILTKDWDQNWPCVLGCQKEKASLFQEQMVWYLGIVPELRILLTI